MQWHLKELNILALVEAPKAQIIPHELSIHEDERIDPYYWLNQRENPEVIAYLKSENSYTKEVMKPTESLQEDLYQEIISRLKEDDESVPYFKNGYWYYQRYIAGAEHPLYCRKAQSLDAKEEVMLDMDEMAKQHAYYHIAGMSVSPDNSKLAYGEDVVSRRIYTIKIRDLRSGAFLEHEIQGTTGGSSWSADGRYLFYTLRDEQTLRSHKVMRYDMEKASSTVVFEEDDETFYCHCYKSKSRKFLIIASSSTTTDEYRFLSADDPLGTFEIFQARTSGMEYSISHFKDRWYILTNWHATNFRLMETLLDETARGHWKELIAHREDTLIEGIETFNRYLVIEEKIKGLNHLRVIDQVLNKEHYLPFDDQTYSCWTGVNPEFDSEVLRFGYSSLTTPTSIFDYNMRTGDKKLMKQQEVVGGYSSSEYDSKRLEVEARDGTKVPISLVYRVDKRQGPMPVLLYGYGSYGHSIDPYFSSVRLSLLDRGFAFAIAHIRGGEDMGRAWYDSGKLLNKKNSFFDFIDCGHFLIEQGWARKDGLYAMGGSAGGLLMGAVINLEPELWSGVVAAVPFVDVVTTMLDESIPLTTGEYDEWGNPNDPEFYQYIKSYSPYDNVVDQSYPPMLVTTGLHDSQVQYWEPAKWIAKMRTLTQNRQPLLLFTNMEAGHGGASGRYETHKETALEYAFLLMLENEELV